MGLPDFLSQAASGSWGDACLAWRRPWRAWRSIESVREVQAMRRAQRSRGARFVIDKFTPQQSEQLRFHRAAAWIALATDELEVITMTLRAALEQTQATAGLAHLAVTPGGAFETRSAIGLSAMPSLGGLVDRSDPAIRAAQFGASILNVPQTTAGAISAWRLGDKLPGGLASVPMTLQPSKPNTAIDAPLSGVAVIPIYCGVGLAAVLELGRADHPFRQTDRSLFSMLGRRASAKLARDRASALD
ncbi:MAG: hypothetical protein U0271_12045 [Polyangiaceae bacterium]